MRSQLRRYRIQPGHAPDFAAEWERRIAPLRRSMGFRVSGWLVDGADEFVWLVEHDTAQSFDAAEDAYYNSDERQGMDPDPARWIVEARKDWVSAVG